MHLDIRSFVLEESVTENVLKSNRVQLLVEWTLETGHNAEFSYFFLRTWLWLM